VHCDSQSVISGLRNRSVEIRDDEMRDMVKCMYVAATDSAELMQFALGGELV
jgi:hypothetical protein